MTAVSEKVSDQQLRVFEAIAATTPDFFYAFDLDGRLLYANSRLLKVWGLTPEQAVGKSLHELGYPQWHADLHMREIQQIIQSKRPVKGEVPFTGGSGISGVYEYFLNPTLDAEGNVEQIVGTTRDVTERAGLHSALAAEREKLATLIKQAPSFIAVLRGPNHLFEMANERFFDFIGKRDIIDKPLRDVLPEMREQGVIDILDKVYSTGETFAGDRVPIMLNRSGDNPLQRRYSNFVYQAVRDASGNVSGICMHGIDVTDEVEGEQVLKDRQAVEERAQAHLAAIVESSDDAIVSKTLDGIIQSWNSGARRIFGYTADETIGRSILMLLPPERYAEETVILSRLRNGERIDHYESVRVTKDGQHIDVSLTISPVRDSTGRVIGASKVARDITRQKRYERDLQAAKEMAELANRQKDELLESERAARAEVERAGRIKDEFLATLSHELRTPLNAILGWSQILCKAPPGEDVAEGLKIIDRNARVQAQIIEDLLDMSRIVSGKIRLDVQRLDLASVVSAAVETVRPTAETKGVKLTTVLDPLAGPVSGDANRLQQVFWNLLTNAVKFTPRGGGVHVVLERVNSHLEVSVIDTGEGIAPEFLPHVFDRFRQADAGTTRRHGGLGLGLAIVKQLVELHGGSVRAKSGGVHTGSTFTVMLPLTIIHPEPEPVTERRHPAVGSMPLSMDTCTQIEGVKVLVVDDEADARTLVRRLLEDCKADVSTASTADEALDLVKQERPQVIVSDIGMPGEDGYSLIRRVRALPREQGGDTPAVALTAYARAEDRMKAVLAGFQHHVVKPVEPAELITLVAILATSARR